MKQNYLQPQIEIINVEIEDAILAQSNDSTVESMTPGVQIGNDFSWGSND